MDNITLSQESDISFQEQKSRTQKLIDILKILNGIGVDVTKMTFSDTVGSLAEKSNITIATVQQVGLNSTDKIGNVRNNITMAYRKKLAGEKTKNIPPTEEEVKELEDLGIFLDKRQSAVKIFIDKLKILKEIDVDLTNITYYDTIESLANRSDVSITIVKQVGLDPTYRIGIDKNAIAVTYRAKLAGKNKKGIPPTNEEIEELGKLGVSLDKQQSETEKFIDILKRLRGLGIDITQIKRRDKISDLAKKSNMSDKMIKEAGLSPNYSIGGVLNNIAAAYRKKITGEKTRYIPPTEEEVKELKKLGISLEYRRKSQTETFIDTLETLIQLGVDITQIQTSDTIAKLAQKSKVSLEKIEEVGLSPNYNIGKIKIMIIAAYRKRLTGQKTKNIPPTEEEVKTLKEMGILLEYMTESKNPKIKKVESNTTIEQILNGNHELQFEDVLYILGLTPEGYDELLEKNIFSESDTIKVAKSKIQKYNRENRKGTGKASVECPLDEETKTQLRKLAINAECIEYRMSHYHESLEAAVNYYCEKGQKDPTYFKFTKNDVLLKHFLLYFGIDSSEILEVMRNNYVSLRQAFQYIILKGLCEDNTDYFRIIYEQGRDGEQTNSNPELKIICDQYDSYIRKFNIINALYELKTGILERQYSAYKIKQNLIKSLLENGIDELTDSDIKFAIDIFNKDFNDAGVLDALMSRGKKESTFFSGMSTEKVEEWKGIVNGVKIYLINRRVAKRYESMSMSEFASESMSNDSGDLGEL